MSYPGHTRNQCKKGYEENPPGKRERSNTRSKLHGMDRLVNHGRPTIAILQDKEWGVPCCTTDEASRSLPHVSPPKLIFADELINVDKFGKKLPIPDKKVFLQPEQASFQTEQQRKSLKKHDFWLERGRVWCCHDGKLMSAGRVYGQASCVMCLFLINCNAVC